MKVGKSDAALQVTGRPKVRNQLFEPMVSSDVLTEFIYAKGSKKKLKASFKMPFSATYTCLITASRWTA